MSRPIPGRQCDSAVTVSSRRVYLLGLALLGLILQLQIRSVQQGPQPSVGTIAPRPVLVGLKASPAFDLLGYVTSLFQEKSSPVIDYEAFCGFENDYLGVRTSLSLNGTIAAIGAPYYGSDCKGYVQVLRFKNNAWTQLGSTLFGAASAEASSTALSDDGSVLAVGGLNSRNVQVFRYVDDDWGPLGNNITNRNGEDIGWALAISGDGTILAAAASSPNVNGYVGEVRVFELVEGIWSQKGQTLLGQGEERDFGGGVSLSQDGSVLAVGIPGFSDYRLNGFVRVFEFIDNDWVQIGQTLNGTNAGNDHDKFGVGVSLSSDGRTLAVGSSGFSDRSSDNLGSVHAYRFGSDGQWFEPGSMLIGKSGFEYFGDSIALSGDASILVASGVGLLRIFEANGDEWIEVGEQEATNSQSNNAAAISRDGSTAMGGASVFDVSCPTGTTVTPIMSS